MSDIFTQYKKQLSEFITYKSISTDKSYKSEIEGVVKWLEDTFKENEFAVNVVHGYGNPIVVARYEVSNLYETCLIYGHYDVQPANKEDGWRSDPFELIEDNGRLYARGVVDNKGQVLIHMATIFSLIKEKNLNQNIVFMIEGDEETGSPKMPQFIKDHAELLNADYALISDGERGDVPTIEVGFRGGFNSTITISTANTDLHSGLYGGISPSAAHEMNLFLAKLFDQNYKVRIPGFYDLVEPISSDLLNQYQEVCFDTEQELQKTGTQAIVQPDAPLHPWLQVGLMPSVQVSGITSGYTGIGYRNGIPAVATAKINFRLVKNQDPNQIIKLFKDFVVENLPGYVKHQIEISDPYEGIKLDLNNKYIIHIQQTLMNLHKREPIYKYCGGGLPIVTLYSEILGIPVIPVSLGNDDCNMHGTNENFNIEFIKQGIGLSEELFSKKQ